MTGFRNRKMCFFNAGNTCPRYCRLSMTVLTFTQDLGECSIFQFNLNFMFSPFDFDM